MYDHHIGYANVPLWCCFSVWERANGHVHQCARVAASERSVPWCAQMWQSKETNVASRDKLGLVSRSLNNVQSTQRFTPLIGARQPGIAHGFHLRQEVDVNKGPHLPLKTKKSHPTRHGWHFPACSLMLSANTKIR